ncbi:MAG: hypothetical protein JZU65_11055 [Chlorobium sp.]|jgi:hypothetical protein|nr:hypothetical protein [Chlorobium phaeobacteroides]MBV5328157.1 hypothetical protein [Chlorobium sp.]
MNGLLVDSNIILDVFLDDPVWADWSEVKRGLHCRTFLSVHMPQYRVLI